MDDWIKAAARELAKSCGNLAITHDAPDEESIAGVIFRHYSAAHAPDRAAWLAESGRQTELLAVIENAIRNGGS